MQRARRELLAYSTDIPIRECSLFFSFTRVGFQCDWRDSSTLLRILLFPLKGWNFFPGKSDGFEIRYEMYGFDALFLKKNEDSTVGYSHVFLRGLNGDVLRDEGFEVFRGDWKIV